MYLLTLKELEHVNLSFAIVFSSSEVLLLILVTRSRNKFSRLEAMPAKGAEAKASTAKAEGVGDVVTTTTTTTTVTTTVTTTREPRATTVADVKGDDEGDTEARLLLLPPPPLRSVAPSTAAAARAVSCCCLLLVAAAASARCCGWVGGRSLQRLLQTANGRSRSESTLGSALPRSTRRSLGTSRTSTARSKRQAIVTQRC